MHEGEPGSGRGDGPSPELYPAHRVYVGKPEWFDVLGGRHFMLLFLLGLREHHRVLDFGCGSLRSGRLLIPYLLPERYFGIDPNRWLIDAAIASEFGPSVLEVKRPRFDFNAECRLDIFGVAFDFIHAHSIFTHAPRSMIRQFLASLPSALLSTGVVVGTWVQGDEDYAGEEWAYPATVTYQLATFRGMVEEAGFACHLLRWPHPEQSYFVICRPEFDVRILAESSKEDFGIEILA